jgi:hypothetical protein
VLYTIKPVAGEAIVVTSLFEDKATLGGKNPLFVEETSRAAEAFGEFVPIPV